MPALSISQGSSNILVSWSASPLAEFNTNSFYLQVNSNLNFNAVFTNYVTNTMPYSTNITVFTNLITNLVPPSNWVAVTKSPLVTNLFIGGYTNTIYQYSFPSTNSMRYFRLESLTY